MQAVSGRTRESGKRPRLTSGLRGARCWGRTVSIDSEVRTLDHLNDFRHSLRPSHPSTPFLRPLRHSFRHSAIPILPPFPSFRHSCAPSVIPAEAGIHATAQPCDEPPSAIPILPPFLRPLRHSCGGRNPCDRPTVRRASIRPTAHQSPQRAAGDRAPSNIGSARDPTDRMDSCLRRNDGQAGVTEGRRSDRAAPEPARTYKGGSRRPPAPPATPRSPRYAPLPPLRPAPPATPPGGTADTDRSPTASYTPPPEDPSARTPPSS